MYSNRIHRDKLFSLDVLVNDGSFISSQGPSGTFFTHSFWDSSSEKVGRISDCFNYPSTFLKTETIIITLASMVRTV